jgi:hypothetical protein
MEPDPNGSTELRQPVRSFEDLSRSQRVRLVVALFCCEESLGDGLLAMYLQVALSLVRISASVPNPTLFAFPCKYWIIGVVLGVTGKMCTRWNMPTTKFKSEVGRKLFSPKKLSLSMETWSQGGLRYFVIGDASAADIDGLGKLFKAAS